MTIELDTSLNPHQVSCSYDDGKDNVVVKDSFVKHRLHLKRKYYGQSAGVRLTYHDIRNNWYTNEFFVAEKPAIVSVSLPSDAGTDVLPVHRLVNAKVIYDTVANQMFRRLTLYRMKEAQALADLWQQQGNKINGNDSLAKVHQALVKRLNERSLNFLRNHTADYFSFWYFRKQIVESSLAVLSRDTMYLKHLLMTLQNIFPKKRTQSVEGVALIKKLRNHIWPPLLDKMAPDFAMKDLTGVITRLRDFRGRYVLLDFWASWCLPCRVNNPSLRAIKEKYEPVGLALISISVDETADHWLAAIEKDQMNWRNLCELKGWTGSIPRSYSVQVVPTYILVDPTGKVVLRTENELPKLSEALKRVMKQPSNP